MERLPFRDREQRIGFLQRSSHISQVRPPKLCDLAFVHQPSSRVCEAAGMRSWGTKSRTLLPLAGADSKRRGSYRGQETQGGTWILQMGRQPPLRGGWQARANEGRALDPHPHRPCPCRPERRRRRVSERYIRRADPASRFKRPRALPLQWLGPDRKCLVRQERCYSAGSPPAIGLFI